MKTIEAKVWSSGTDNNIVSLRGEWTEPIFLDATSQLPEFPVEALMGRKVITKHCYLGYEEVDDKRKEK